MEKAVALTVLLLLVLVVNALPVELDESVTGSLTSMPLAFTENQGQWDERVKLCADARDGPEYPLLDRLGRKPDSIERILETFN